MLVHTSCILPPPLDPDLRAFSASEMPKPNSSSRFMRSAVDSLLVLLHSRKGNPLLTSRFRASIAPGVGVDPVCKLPATSMSKAEIGGLFL